MALIDLVRRNRSYRRFDESVAISDATLRDLVALTRITPSAMNAQPLRFILSSSSESNAKIFETLSWAGALKDWDGPAEGERPTGYIVVLVDNTINPNADRDVGIACQTILLGATERDLGGCIVGSVKRKRIKELLEIRDEYAIPLVIALGKPAERVEIEEANPGDPLKYYREPDGSHHVPKRSTDELIIRSYS